jgi:hypothetical protein
VPEEEAIDYLRLMLRAKAAVDLAFRELRRMVEAETERTNQLVEEMKGGSD